MALAPGSRLGPYEVIARLGEGGMGAVYRARDPRLGREVAVKVVHERHSTDPDARQRFTREARAVAALSHPNVVAIHDVGVDATGAYAVMELLEGETLRSRLDRGPLDLAEACAVGAALADGLAAAHARGIVHRDLKPSNVFLTRDGLVKILDFGLAKHRAPLSGADPSGETLSRETTPGALVGTPDYMAPEQVRGGLADARTDVFTLGNVIHEMLAGEQAFARASAVDTLAAILKEEPGPLPASVPSGVGRLLRHCLEKEKDRRPPSARDVAAELRGLAHAAPDMAPEAIDSLAVLPFADLSPQKDQEYFCDGLADELIDALTRIRGLHLASRTSSFQWKGTATDVREIGRRLGVRAVLEGSVRKSGDRLRITVQVTDVTRGFSLSSERYDRAMADVFALQEDIAQTVAAALKVTLSEGDRRAREKPPTHNLRAYDLYLRARGLFNQTGDAVPGAYDLFRQALDLDPEFAQAHAALAATCAWLYQWRGRQAAHLEEALRESAKALAQRPDLALAHGVRGTVLALAGQAREAETHFETALALNPRLYEALYTYARTCLEQGRLEEAARLFERAALVRPEDYQSRALLALALTGLGRDELARHWHRETVEVASRHLERNPHDVRAVSLGGGSFVQLGEIERGLEWLERARAMTPEDGGTLYNVACGFAQAGEYDRALDVLEESLDRAVTNLDWIANDPDWAPLRDHPRFRALLDRLR